jgi:hypothetical protein
MWIGLWTRLQQIFMGVLVDRLIRWGAELLALFTKKHLDKKTGEENSKKVEEVLNNENSTDEDIKKASADLLNGRPR